MVKNNSNWFEEYGITDPYYSDKYRVIIKGDNREVLSSIHGVSAVVTDPPYELGFMGKSWDSKGVSFSPATWSIIRQSCKSGAPMLSFGGTRTQHRIACAIEDAGWEIRDCLMWVYGSGFPKSLDISKAIDKVNGEYVKGVVLPSSRTTGASGTGIATTFREKTAANPQSSESTLWNGWGTALKPAYEPIILAMNPVDKTFANNALKYGVAGLNIDGCRVEYASEYDKSQATPQGKCTSKEISAIGAEPDAGRDLIRVDFQRPEQKGRFPANFTHDGSDEVLELFPNVKAGVAKEPNGKQMERSIYGATNTLGRECGYRDNGSAARFFMRCERDDCTLCILLIQLRHDIMNAGELPCQITRKLNILAQCVERYFGSILAITENSVRENVQREHVEQSAQSVKYAANLCDSCEIHIALVLAEIRTLDFSREELQVILGCIGNSRSYTLIQSLVSSAEKWESIGTTRTTTDLLILFGCANPVITNSTLETERFARFKYAPKASRSERDNGLEGIKTNGEQGARPNSPDVTGKFPDHDHRERGGNNHPTVKPLALMTYLCKLIKMPEYNLILDPFCGSGTTLLACGNLNIRSIGIDSDEKSCEISANRCASDTVARIQRGEY